MAYTTLRGEIVKNMVHWNVFERKWTSKTYKSCGRHKRILIVGKWNTEVKPEKKDNPRGWVYADHSQIILEPTGELLSQYIKSEKLIYDKNRMEFSIEEGVNLLFDEDGCFTLKEVRHNGDGNEGLLHKKS